MTKTELTPAPTTVPPVVFTLTELAKLTGAKLVGDGSVTISGVADLDCATVADASFLANPTYYNAMQRSSAGVVFVTPSVDLIDGRNFLVTDEPSRAFQAAVELLLNDIPTPTAFSGIHPTAVIHSTAQVADDVQVGPHAVIDAEVTISTGTTIGAGCYVGPKAEIGANTTLYPRVVIREGCSVGDRVILQPGVVIGGCGFGYTQDEQGRFHKLAHLSNVIIENDVEVGANATIDRGRLKPTRIGRGTKIDNLVQIGHNVSIGPDNVIVAQTGFAGSAKTGARVAIGGQVAINGHIEIGDGVMIAAKSGVPKSIRKAGKYGGAPAVPFTEFMRNVIMLGRIDKYIEQIKELQRRIDLLEAIK